MADLIDRQALLKEICNSCDGYCDNVECDCVNCKRDCRCDLVIALAEAPTIEAEPVKWIPVEEGLPEEDKYVLIWCGSVQVAKIEKGISMAERKAMEDGLIDNPIEHGWRAAEGWTSHRRSEVIRACDEWGNNLVPYHWYADGGLMSWFGQKVTHWMPLPEPPNCGAKMDGE